MTTYIEMATEDTFFSTQQPTSVLGFSSTAGFGNVKAKGGPFTERAAFIFADNLTAEDKASPIVSASLVLEQVAHGFAGSADAYVRRHIDPNLGEGVSTWNNAIEPGTAWSDADQGMSDATNQVTFTITSPSPQTYTMDVTALVQDMIDAGDATFSFGARRVDETVPPLPATGDGFVAKIACREHATVDEAKLTIVTAVGGGGACGINLTLTTSKPTVCPTAYTPEGN